jgi:CubicO group peptidase (beta-lactamase class C family)
LNNYFSPNLIKLPGSLTQVTDIGSDEIDPHKVGMDSAAIDKIWAATEKLYKSRAMPAISLAVRHKGELILNRSLGHASGNGPKDKNPDGGKLHDPVAEYIPEFAARGKQYITVGQVLSHRGGFPTIKMEDADPSILWDWDACLDLLCQAKPRKDAGTTQAYHAITGGFILGEIMRRVTGQSLQEIIKSRIADPLGARYMSYGLTPERQTDAALNYFTGRPEIFPANLVVKRALGGPFSMVCDVSNSPEFMSAAIPAGNVYATAREASDFFQCLLNGGTFNGKRLFERATVARAISEASARQFDRTLLIPLRTSEGLMLGDYPFGLYGPRTSEAFGHLGFIAIFCWADPARDISVSLLTTGKPIVSPHLPPLIGFLRTINNAFPKFEAAGL